MKNKLLILTLSSIMANSFAIIVESGVAVKEIIASSSGSTAIKAPFTIYKNAPLSVELLNNCWFNRQDLKNQEIIANYLMETPAIPTDYAVAWLTARLVSFIGNYGLGEKRFLHTSEGVKLFNYGAKAGEIASKIEPSKVEGYYWYAANLGSYGIAKGIISSAMNAKVGIKALIKAKGINASYQGFGSSRILGKYYQELPSMFGGDDKQALELFKEATISAPQFKNNWVYLGNYYLKHKEYKEALGSCQTAITEDDLAGKYEEMRYSAEANKCITTAKEKLD